MMLIGDGVTPGNDGRGYVLRRLLRRAVRSMRLLGCEDRVLPELMPISPRQDGRDLRQPPHRLARASPRSPTPRRTRSARRSRPAPQIFDLAAAEVKQAGGSTLSGERAFALHDTYGFPIDLTLEMAAEQGLAVDEQGFRGLMAEQRERAKADARAKKGAHGDTAVYRGVFDEFGPTEWLGLRDARDRVAPAGAAERRRAVPRLARGRDRRAGARPHPVLRRVRRPGRRRRHDRLRRRPARGARRPAPDQGPGRAPGARARGRARPRARRCTRGSTPSGASARARRTPAPTSCTPPCARCSAPRRCSPAPTTGPATSASTSAGRRRSAPTNAAIR